MRYGAKLLDVLRPGRYEGIEAAACVKNPAEVEARIALAFPDVYEIGTSHLGLQILYEILNDMPNVWAERAFAPWSDMEEMLRREGMPLISRESGTPLKDFDLVGFTLQYELSATNVLTMLDLGGIPLFAAERGEGDPIVMGGGPVAANPEPYADFFDAFFIGEAEEGIQEIAEALANAKRAGLSRADSLAALGRIEGVYLPSSAIPRFERGRFNGFDFPGGTPVRVKRRIVAEINAFPPPRRPIVTFGETVHERLAIEVARGCTRGCRFCQAGYLYRPTREREPGQIINAIRNGIEKTGHEEVGLLSLSTGDYSCVGALTANLIDELGPAHVSVSLPSLRIDSLDPRLARHIARVRKTGFTLAPEAGGENLRRKINKDFSDEEIINSIRSIFDSGWKGVKLYFMVGLPFETEEDRRDIARLVKRIISVCGGGKNRLTVSVSNFVPKPHTPFQWAAQAAPDEIMGAQEILRREIPFKKADLKYHDAAVSRIEGIFSRGDRRLGQVILAAWKKGCRMDGWSSEFSARRWEEALAECAIDAGEYLRERGHDEPLPWDIVEAGATREYLLAELLRGAEGTPTGDCRTGKCTGCGLCDFETVKPRSALETLEFPEVREAPAEEEAVEQEGDRLRFIFAKTGPAALLSHLETTRLLLRAFRSAKIPVSYSHGFNPHPKLQLGPALSLGVESLCETGEMRVIDRPALEGAIAAVNARLPEGLRVESIWHMGRDTRTLTGGGMEEEYRLAFSGPAAEKLAALGGVDALIADYREKGGLSVVKRRKGKPDRVLEASEFVLGLWRDGETLAIRILRKPDGATLSPEAFLAALLGMPEGVRALDRVVKTHTKIY